MSRVPNADPYVHAEPDNFQLQGGFVRHHNPLPPAAPPRPPQPISAADALCRHSGDVYWYVEYWLRNVKAGRFMSGPYIDRRNAVARAVSLLEQTQYEHEVERVTVLAMKGGAQ